MNEKPTDDMSTAELVGGLTAVVVIRTLLLRGLFKAAKQDRPAKAIAYAVLLMSGGGTARSRRLAYVDALAERLSPDEAA